MKAPSQTKSKIIIIAIGVLLLLLAGAILVIGQKINQPKINQKQSQAKDYTNSPPPSNGVSYSETALLQEKVRSLMQKEVPDLAKQQKISLDEIVELEKRISQADKLWQKNETQQAGVIYQYVFDEIENRRKDQKSYQQMLQAESQLLQQLSQLEPIKNLIIADYNLALQRSDEGQWAKNQKQWNKALQNMQAGLAALSAYQDPQTLLEQWVAAIEEDYLNIDSKAAQSKLDLLLNSVSNPDKYQELIDKVGQLSQIEKLWNEAQAQHRAKNIKLALQYLTQILVLDETFPPALAEQETWKEDLLKEEASGFHVKAQEAFNDKELERAQQYNQQSLTIYPQYPEALSLRRKIAEAIKQRTIKNKLNEAYQKYQEKKYAEAKDLYREILALDPQQGEAMSGLETTSLLLSAQIKFNASLKSAQKLASEGRYPIAIEYFNKALASKPTSLDLTPEQKLFEEELIRQSQKVEVTITSDNKSYVSVIGVLPPTQFRKKTLSLYPDVYKLTSTRKDYYDEQDTLKVSADHENKISIECQNKK